MAAAVPRAIALQRDAPRSVDYRAFAGVIQRDTLPALGRLALRLLGGRFGDLRDWAEIEAWADRIGGELTATIRPGSLR